MSYSVGLCVCVFGIIIMLYLCGVVRVIVVWVKCVVGCEGRGIMKNITYN
jgi:hypothetical protein